MLNTASSVFALLSLSCSAWFALVSTKSYDIQKDRWLPTVLYPHHPLKTILGQESKRAGCGRCASNSWIDRLWKLAPASKRVPVSWKPLGFQREFSVHGWCCVLKYQQTYSRTSLPSHICDLRYIKHGFSHLFSPHSSTFATTQALPIHLGPSLLPPSFVGMKLYGLFEQVAQLLTGSSAPWAGDHKPWEGHRTGNHRTPSDFAQTNMYRIIGIGSILYI